MFLLYCFFPEFLYGISKSLFTYEVIYGQENTHPLPSRMTPRADKPKAILYSPGIHRNLVE